ncbi:hypothetical protein M2D07_005170 [Pseudomonas sp. BGr12]|uniref:hypothetical protein n=1 Tax=unclassified Pseudomonas TaxID=196821 RepID=UPI00177F033D|nr:MULTISPECIES: hypothetical protein [unclassified Pseudomonas]MBD9499246.1 hypothetical protein [Pseudomonas sp. PDM17]MDL2426402.1 hypothetical protein [Pseudomonas sp. BJa5]
MQAPKTLPLFAALALAAMVPAMAADIPLGTAVVSDEVVTKVISVDAKDRRIVVEDEAGKPLTVQLTDAAQDLGHLRAGDYIAALVVHSAAFDLDTQVQTQAPGALEIDGAAMATPTNPHPGGDAFRMARVQLKIVGINLKKHELTFEGPNGATKVVQVDDAKLRSRMNELKTGQILTVTYEDTLQIVTAHPVAQSAAPAKSSN